MMTDHKLYEIQALKRQQCLFRAFADINRSFADWYQATEKEAEKLAEETFNN